MLGQTTLAHFVFAKAALPALKQDRSASMLFISEGAGGLGGGQRWMHQMELAAVAAVLLGQCCAQLKLGGLRPPRPAPDCRCPPQDALQLSLVLATDHHSSSTQH